VFTRGYILSEYDARNGGVAIIFVVGSSRLWFGRGTILVNCARSFCLCKICLLVMGPCHQGGQAPFFLLVSETINLSHKSSHSKVQNDGVHRANIRRTIIIAILRGPIGYLRVNSDNTVTTGGSRQQ
jgi:hypothetical protein